MASTTNRKSIWGWYFYDWASQPYNTLLITFIFAPYFTSAVAENSVEGQAMWARMTWMTGMFLAVASPIFGAIADSAGPRKPWIFVFSVMYVVGAAYLWNAVPGSSNIVMILLFFAIGMAGMELSQTFVNSMLPTLAPRSEIGKISGSGWAFGYAGGVIALFLMLLFFAESEETGLTLIGISPLLGLDAEAREGTRFVSILTAVWFVVFMIPFFFWVKDETRRSNVGEAVGKGLSELLETLGNLPNNRSLMIYLGSSMFYRDALIGLYAFGGIYASGVMGWTLINIGIFGIISAITGAIFCYIGGFVDQAIGPKRVIAISVSVLILVSILIVGLSREAIFGMPVAEGSNLPNIMFFIAGACIGAAGGVLQASSRTFMVDQADPERMTEAYGLYAMTGKATAFLAPGLIDLATSLSGSQRVGVSPVIGLFAIGLILLFWVRSSKEYR
ncbi:MFS transporter [Amylibacter sp. IMCC11727]|uniref:MFS transporter n=1 Tax=Amylibacter sp. IMCC11727 TaxID=3039851 RepID=UPI00244DF941|nr:MFS transporter [Amylibacter sp. IMCC11727]WGI21937.1 MFS transporter [Amylibacter sp. IMCC11727]